jgi:hypothetical protein
MNNNTGIMKLTPELLLDILMLQGFKVVDARFVSDYNQIHLTVEHELIESKDQPTVMPVYHRNEFGVTRLIDILIDGKSTNEVNDGK